jgi:hypothetical protein
VFFGVQFAGVESFHGVLQDQVCYANLLETTVKRGISQGVVRTELVPASQHTDQFAPVAEDEDEFFWPVSFALRQDKTRQTTRLPSHPMLSYCVMLAHDERLTICQIKQLRRRRKHLRWELRRPLHLPFCRRRGGRVASSRAMRVQPLAGAAGVVSRQSVHINQREDMLRCLVSVEVVESRGSRVVGTSRHDKKRFCLSHSEFGDREERESEKCSYCTRFMPC